MDARSDVDICPINCCAEVICGKWTVLVIRDLLEGPKYFRDLERSLAGISPRTLCDRLKFLGERGIVSRTYIKALPPRSEYELTELGLSLAPIINEMAGYGRLLLELMKGSGSGLGHIAVRTNGIAKPR